MKTLVIYYSYSGNTKFAAQIVASELHADLEELRPQKTLHASGAGYVMWGLRQLVSQSAPPLEPLQHDPADYDRIVIGTPVWSIHLHRPYEHSWKTAGCTKSRSRFSAVTAAIRERRLKK